MCGRVASSVLRRRWDLSAHITDMQNHRDRYGLTEINLSKVFDAFVTGDLRARRTFLSVVKNYEAPKADGTKNPPEETLFWDGAGHFTTKVRQDLFFS